MAVVIEAGKLGRQVDGRGVVKEFTPEFFKEVSESYDPANFKAPAIISHDTKGVPDDKLHDNKELSYGAASWVKVVGDRLKIGFKKLSPKVKEYFDNGELLSVSPSFYPPSHHANPNPGKWSLRHCALLGATPPAIKGMAAPEFSETGYNPVEHCLDFSFPIKLSESEGTLEFSIYSQSTRSLLSNIRDWLIEKDGKEQAEKILPSEMISNMEREDTYLQEEIRDLRKQVMRLKYPNPERDMAIADGYSESSDFKEMSLGQKIEKLAKDKGVKRSALAKAAGITESTVGQIINGEIDRPPKKRLKGFAKALGISLEDLMPKDYDDQTTDMSEKTMKTKHKNSKSPIEPDLMEDEDDDEEGTDGTEEQVTSKKKKKSMDLSEGTIDYAEELAEERRQRRLLEAQVLNDRRIATEERAKAEHERQARKQDNITNFCEGLVKEGFLSAAQMGDRILEYGEGEESQITLPEFMMSLDDEQLSFMEDFLQTQPKVIEYNEFAPDGDSTIKRADALDFSAVNGASVSEESIDEYQEILQYCEKNSLDPDKDEDFNKAAAAVLN